MTGKYPARQKTDEISIVRQYAPRWLKRTVVRTSLTYGKVVVRNGVLPRYLIIGAQRGGTTSLHKALSQHPGVVPPRVKEIHYFDQNSERPVEWYRSHFPSPRAIHRAERAFGHAVTGEATPDYLFYPEVPSKVAAMLPDVRLIVLLRNPVDRAYSHYQHEVALGHEHLGFQQAVEAERARLAGPTEAATVYTNPYEAEHHSYIQRGLYVDQLVRWLHIFPASQVQIVQSEQWYAHPHRVYQAVLHHIGLTDVCQRRYPRRNGLRYECMEDDVRRWLSDIYQPYNEQLFSLLGTRFTWNG